MQITRKLFTLLLWSASLQVLGEAAKRSYDQTTG